MSWLTNDNMRLWWDVVQSIVIGLFVVYGWVLTRTKANQDAINELSGRFDRLDKQIQVIQTDLDHQPNKEDITRLHGRIDQVAEGVKHMEGQLKQLNQTLVIIQQHLVQSGKAS